MSTDPGTRSPGHLVIFYNDRGVSHSCSVALVADVDLGDIAQLRTNAADLAAEIAPCLPSNRTITGWGIRPAGGGSTYTESFPTPIAGSSGTDSGTQDFYSYTFTLMGRAAGTGVGGARGSTRLVLHVGNAHIIPVGGLIWIGALPLAEQNLVDFLAASTRMFADYFGQKADFTGRMTVQFNAHTQRTAGL